MFYLITGLSSFTDLYTKLLEHYQAVSYGDEMFSACVLVPLAHCHDICWRKQIWSEHSGLLRVLNCPEEKVNNLSLIINHLFLLYFYLTYFIRLQINKKKSDFFKMFWIMPSDPYSENELF